MSAGTSGLFWIGRILACACLIFFLVLIVKELYKGGCVDTSKQEFMISSSEEDDDEDDDGELNDDDGDEQVIQNKKMSGPLAYSMLSPNMTPIKYIQIIKDSTNKPNATEEEKSFGINEITTFSPNRFGVWSPSHNNIFSDTRRYTKRKGKKDKNSRAFHLVDGHPSTYTQTSGNKNIHKISLIVKLPIPIKKVEILNRGGIHAQRLAGAVLVLMDKKRNIVKSHVLDSSSRQVIIL